MPVLNWLACVSIRLVNASFRNANRRRRRCPLGIQTTRETAITEQLESRKMLSGAPVSIGPETLVNTFTTNQQVSPSVASDAAGDQVVVWTSFDQAGRHQWFRHLRTAV